MEQWQERLRQEYSQLTYRLQKLIDFLASPAAAQLPKQDFHLLDQQHKAMFHYWVALVERMQYHKISNDGLPALTPKEFRHGK